MRDADDPDAASMVAEAHLVPRALRSLLPHWDPEVGRRKLGQHFLVEGTFIHYNVGNPDPVLIYSKDSMHQVGPYTRYINNYSKTDHNYIFKVSAGGSVDLPPFKSIFDEDGK